MTKKRLNRDTFDFRFSIFNSALVLLAVASSASAQSGSLGGKSTLTLPSGRAVRMAESSLLYQPAPRQKVFQVEDIVHVHIKQDWAYNNTANNRRKKNITAEGRLTYWSSIAGFFNLPTKAAADTLPEIGGEINHNTQNQGNLQRKEMLDFKMSCRVISVQENGNLVVEGTSSSNVGEEGKIMYVGGIIRPEDIGPDNTILGSRVSELTVKEIPSGNVYDTVRRPWGTRLVEHWKPF